MTSEAYIGGCSEHLAAAGMHEAFYCGRCAEVPLWQIVHQDPSHNQAWDRVAGHWARHVLACHNARYKSDSTESIYEPP